MIYDITENKRIHNIRLTHPISSIDVWSGYLLIGSSVVHVVDTREDHWRRILVVDMDEKESLKVISAHSYVIGVYPILSHCTGSIPASRCIQ